MYKRQAPGVEGTPDRLRGEAVDGRAALGLDVGAERERLGERGEQRAGRDRGEVRLEDHVVERLRQQRGEHGGGVGLGGEQRAGGGGEGAAAGDAEEFGLGQGPADQVFAQVAAVGVGLPAAQRALPAQGGQEFGGGGRGAGRELGEQGQCGAADRRGEGAVQFGAERGALLALAVGGAGQGRDAGRGEPGAGEHGPACGGVQAQPLVVPGRRRPVLVDLAVRGQQAGGVGEFEPERGGLLGALQGLGGALEIAHPEAAGTQGGRRGEAPELQQFLDGPDGGVRLPGGRAVHRPGIARRGGRRGLGLERFDGAVRASAAQVQGEFAGQDDAAGAGGQQQAPGQQPFDRALGVLRGDRAGGVRDGAGGRSPDQPVEQPQRGLGGGGEQGLAAGAVAEQGGERGDGGDRVGRRGLPGGGEQLLEPGRGHAGARLGEGRAQAGAAGVGGGRRERLAGRDDQAQAVVGTPEQGPVAQGGQGAGQRGGDGGAVGGAQRGGLGVRLHLRRAGQQGAHGGR